MRFYMDYNASAPINSKALELMMEVHKYIGNPSSIHTSGRKVRTFLEDTREKIGIILDNNSQNIIFTSGATEANALAFKLSHKPSVIMSAIEHPSVLNQSKGANLIKVLENGIICLKDLEKILQKQKDVDKLVSVMAVNNETGIIQPLEKVSSICKKYRALLHVDAVQAFGRIPITMNKLEIDLLTISSHKIGGPKGAGCLLYSDRVKNKLIPLIKGGGQEKGLRAGTEAVAQIAGFGMAAELIKEVKFNEIEFSRDLLERSIKNNIKDVEIIGENSPRVSNTSLISFKGVSAKKLVISLDLEGFEVSSGSACSSGKVTDSHVLMAMGIEKNIVEGAIRISLCEPILKKDIDLFVETLQNIIFRLRDREKNKV